MAIAFGDLLLTGLAQIPAKNISGSAKALWRGKAKDNRRLIMARVFLGIGSNIGNRNKNIRRALKLLKNEGIKIEKISKIINTKPVGGPPQRDFLNATIKVNTDFSPHTLLRKIKKIEKQMGRTRGVRFGPRVIDLDILLYNNLTLKTKVLTIPHPRMWQREFVMKPLRSLISPVALRKLKKQICCSVK